MQGWGLKSSSGGTILIDPKDLTFSGKSEDKFSNGSNITIVATDSITLNDVWFSSRNTDTITMDTRTRAAGYNATSDGHSGYITLKAPNINIANSMLYSFSANTPYDGGNIVLDGANITLSNSELLAKKSYAGVVGVKDGQIIINATDTLTIDNNLKIEGSNVNINANKLQTIGNGSDMIFETSGELILRSTTVLTNGGDIKISAPKITLIDSKLLAQSASGSKVGDIIISANDNWFFNTFDYGGRAEVEINIDANSLIQGKDVSIFATAGSGIYFNFQEGTIEPKKADSFLDYGAKILEFIWDLRVSTEGSLGASGRDNRANAKITIDGTIEASKNVNITSLAQAEAEFMSFSTILAGAGARVVADSKIVIGSQAKISSKGSSSDGKGINILSKAITTVDISAMEIGLVNAVPADISFVFSIAESTNTIYIAPGAELTAQNDILVQALTERTNAISAFGGSGDSVVGLTVGVLYGDAETKVFSGGKLSAGNDILLEAKTNTIKNRVGITTTMGDGFYSGMVKAINNKTAIVDKTKKFFFILLKVITKGKVDLTQPSLDKPFDQFGASGAVAVIDDSVNTDVTVDNNAQLTAARNIDINAETLNQIIATASSIIRSYNVNNQDTKKDIGIALSTPLVFMDNTTNAIVRRGAVLKADHLISVDASTKIPYNLTHPIYTVIADRNNFSPSNLTSLLGYNLGIDKGFLNTWGQSISVTDKFSLGGMLSLLFVDNYTNSVVENGVTIAGKTGNIKPDLKITADTTVELGNLVGNFSSFFKMLPDFTDPNWRDKTFGAMWGNESENSAIGAAFLGSFIGNTTIARIDGGTIIGGTINVKDLTVDATTKSIDIGISIGGGKTGGIGIEGMFGFTLYDSYTLAKIDDAATINANSVKIKAFDDAYRIGLAGGLVEGTTGVGISSVATYSDRQVHSVWGNLLDDDGNLAQVKGDYSTETTAGATTNSIVTNEVDILSELSGLNIVAAVAGVLTSQTHEVPDQTAANQTQAVQLLFAEPIHIVDTATRNVKTTQQSEPKSGVGISGAAVVNVLKERSTAGISGNVKITAKDIDVLAKNNILDIAVGGGVTAQTGDVENNTGIAGGIGVNVLDGKTIAYIQPETNGTENQITFSSLDVDASRSGQIISVSVGASGSAAKEGIEVAGSVSINILDDDTFLRINNANLLKKSNEVGGEIVGDITAKATDSMKIISIAGGIVIGGKVAVGGSIAGNYLNLNTHANISNSIIDAKRLLLNSADESSIITIALGGSVGNRFAFGGATAVTLSNGATQTAIQNSTLTLAEDLDAKAVSKAESGGGNYYGDIVKKLRASEVGTDYLSDGGVKLDTGEENINGARSGNETELKFDIASASPKIVTAAVGAAVSNNAVGANIGLNVLTNTTNVTIGGSTITTKGKASFEAGTEGGIIAIGVGVAGGTDKFGVAGNVAMNFVAGSTAVDFNSGANITASKELEAKALNRAGITNVTIDIAIGSKAGVAPSLAYNQVVRETQVNGNGAVLTGKAVDIDAINSASVISLLLSGGFAGEAGTGVSLAVNTVGTFTSSEFRDVAEVNDSSVREAEARQNLAASFGNTDIWETLKNSTNETGINFTDGSITSTDGSIELDTEISGRMITVAVGAGFGKSAGVGVAGAYNNIGGRSNINTNNTIFSQTGYNGKIIANSENKSSVIAVSVGGTYGSTAGIDVNVAVNNLTGKNEITLKNNTITDETTKEINATITSFGDILLNAKNSGSIISVSGGVAGAGTTGVGAAVTVNLLRGDTVAQIIGGKTTTSNSEISINAQNESDIISVAAAGAFAGTVAVAGSVAANYLRNTVEARAGDANAHKTILDAKTGINLDATSSGKILSIGGRVAIAGTVGVAGSLSTNFIRSTTETYIENAVLDTDGVLTDFATSDNDIKNIIVNIAGASNAGVAVVAGLNDIGGTTKTVITGNTEIDALGMFIKSQNTSDSFGVTVTGAGAIFAGVGVGTDVHLLNQNVQTIVQNSELAASATVQIQAIDEKNVKSNVTGVAGGFVGANGSISTVITRGVTLVDFVNANIQTTGVTGDIDILSDNKTILNQVTATISGGLVGVGMSVAVNVIGQESKVTSDNATILKSEQDVDIRAKSEFDINYLQAHSVGGGMIGVAATVAVTTLSDKAIVNIGGQINAKKDVNIRANGIFKKDNSVIGGVGVGGIGGGGAGVDVLFVRSIAELSSSAAINAEDIDLESTVTRNIDQTTYAASLGGIVGLGATVSVINMGGEIDSTTQAAFAESTNKTREMSQKMLQQSSLSQEDKNSLNNSLNVNNLSSGKTFATVLLRVGGMLNATGDITGNATVDNMVNQDVIGVHVGSLVGGGAAVGVLTAKDHVTLEVLNNTNIKANQITLNSLSKVSSIDQDIIAGSAGLLAGLGAAVGVVDISGDVVNRLFNSSNLTATEQMSISAKRDYENIDSRVDSATVAAISASGAVGKVNLGNGNVSMVNVYDNVVLESSKIALTANDTFKNISLLSEAGSGSLGVAGSGAEQYLNIGVYTQITVDNNAKLGRNIIEVTPTNGQVHPVEGDYIHFIADALLDNIKSDARMVSGGTVAVGATLNKTTINLAQSVLTKSSDLRSWDILFGASQQTDNVTAEAWGVLAGGGAGAVSNTELEVTETNYIELDNTLIDSWWDFTAKTGYNGNHLTSLADLYNTAVAPVPIYPNAITNLTRNDNITIKNGTENRKIQSVNDLTLLAGGKEMNYLKSRSQYHSWLVSSDITQIMFSPDETSLLKSGSKINKKLNSLITLENAVLEAGSHYKQWIKIFGKDNIEKSDNFPEIKIMENVDVANLFNDIITAKEKKLNDIKNYMADKDYQAKATHDEKTALTEAYDILTAEITFMKGQADYYLESDGTSKTADFVNFLSGVMAASGNIVFASNDVFLNGNVSLITHEAPTIEIDNYSDMFLSFGDNDHLIKIEIPEQSGGTIFFNGNIVESDVSLLLYNRNIQKMGSGTHNYQSAATSANTPTISIKNHNSSVDLKPELFARNVLFSNYNGLLSIDSSGSTWFYDKASLNARDIKLRTDGVIFQSYVSGRRDIAGNPLALSEISLWYYYNSITNPISLGYSAWLETKYNFEAKYLDDPVTGRPWVSLCQELYEELIKASTLESLIKLQQSAGLKGDNKSFVLVKYNTNEAYPYDLYIYKVGEQGEIGYAYKMGDDFYEYTPYEYTPAPNFIIHDASKKIDLADIDHTLDYENVPLDPYYPQPQFEPDKLQIVVDLVADLKPAGKKITYDPQTATQDEIDAAVAHNAEVEQLQLQLQKEFDERKDDYNHYKTNAEEGNERLKEARYKLQVPVSGGFYALSSAETAPIEASVVGGMTAGRSVFISAEIINVNGRIESGWLDYNIDLNTEAVNNAISSYTDTGSLDLTSIVFADDNKDRNKPNYNGHKINVQYDPLSESIILNNIKAEGGSITLYGNIISTGNGTLAVADGYGNITITANDNYKTVLGQVDTGNGVEGVIKITDTSKKFNDENGIPVSLTTTYERINGTVYYYDNHKIPIENKIELDPQDAKYATTADRWLKDVKASHTVMAVIEKEVATKTFWNSVEDFFNFDWDPSVVVSSYLEREVYSARNIALGEFFITDPDLRVDAGIQDTSVDIIGQYTKDATNITLWKDNYDNQINYLTAEGQKFVSKYKDKLTDEKPTDWKVTKRVLFLVERQNTRISAAVGDYTEIWQVYVNASKSIGIEFMGNDSSPTVGEVNITGAKTISLSDLIHSSNKVNINVTGNNVTGDDKHILSISDAARSKTGAIDAKLVNLQAAGNIGDVTENGNSLRLLGGNYRTVVDAEAQNINIDFRDGKVFVNNVKTTGGEESVLKFRSAGEIYMDKDSNSGFDAAGYLDITADGGKIVKENNPNAVDPNAINFGYFTMTAGNNVRIQSSGDMKIDFTSTLYADSIVSQGGNIDLNVNGNLLDRNPIEEVDPLSDAERSALWSSLGIISGEQENIDRKNTIISGYERLRTNEYFEIWNSIHNAETNEFDLSKYDSDYVFKFTNSQVEDMLKQGTTIENIQKEENNKTAFYHQTLGNGSGQFNENYRYSATDEEKTQMTTGLNWTKKQLQNSIPANLLIQTADAGTRQNTTSMMEEPNISGFNVTINVAGNIGTNTSDNITINSINDLFPEKGHYTNNDEFEEAQENAKKRLRALADAELDDVEVIKDNNGKIISLSIKRYDNLNISATESLKLQANTGWINVGSQDDIKIDNSMPDNGIIAGKNGEQELRLKTDGSIEALNNSNVAIYAKNAILEAANGKIGTNNNLESLIVNLTGNDLNNGWITARANEGIYITFGKSNNDNDTNNAYIREISSQGNIYLKAADFIDALSNSNSAVKIGGIDIILVATHGSIGTQDKWFAIIQKENGSINLSAKNDIYVNHPNGSFNIVGLNANGNVQVKALIDLIVSGTVDVNYNDNTETILTAETGVFKIINETVNTHQKPFTAIAKTDLLIENVINLIAGTTILTAETGNIALTGKDATLDNAIITALEGDIEWNIDNMTITANNDNTEGNALNIHANKNIFSGGTTTVDRGNVKWIADNGSISDIRDQNGSINLDAKNSEVILTAKNGIGTNNSLELSAETLNANVSEIGNISLNLMSDSKLNEIQTDNGIIDINSIGNVTIAQIIVGGTGNDFVLGANNITFVQNSNVKADNRIVIVSQNGNIYSQATNDNNAAIFETGKNGLINLVSFTGSIYGEKSIVLDGANKNVGFLAELNTGKINLVAGNDVFIYDISNATFDFGTIAAQNRVALMFATERNLTIDKIIANKIDVHQNQIKFSELTDQYSANITSIIGNNIDKIMSNNNTLFANTINIKVNETTINNNKKGAELEINDIKIKSQTNLAVVVDRLTIDQIIAGSDSSLTHYGGSRENGGVAEMTLVNDIISTGNFTFKNIKSKEVYAYSNSVNGSVRVINSYSPYRANYDINNVSLVIDTIDKNRSQYYSYFNRKNEYPDFRIWSLNGTYDFNLSREQLSFNNPNMLTLSAMNHNILLNGNATYTDSAFEDLLTEHRHAIENSVDGLLLYSDKILKSQIYENTINSQQVNILPLTSTINFYDIFNSDSPIIVPINDNQKDDDEEDLEKATTENNNTEQITITQHKYTE